MNHSFLNEMKFVIGGENLNDGAAVEKYIWLSEHIKDGIQMLCLTKDLSSDNELGL